MSFFETNIKRNQTTTLLIDDAFEETDVFLRMRDVQTVASCLAISAGLGTSLYLFFVSRKINRNDAQKHVFFLLCAHIFFMMLDNIVILTLSVVNFSPSRWLQCSILGTLPSMMYVAAHTITYLIFIQRARVANMVQSKFMKHLLFLLKFGTYSIPGFLIFMAIIIRGRLLPNYVCIQSYPWWVAILFLIADSSLSTGFLILFIVPVMSQISAMKSAGTSAESSKKLAIITRRNCFWSTFMISTSFTFMLTITIIPMRLALGEVRTDNYYHFYLVDWLIGPIDCIFNLFGTLAITMPVWRPKSARVKAEQNSSNQQASKAKRKSMFSSTGKSTTVHPQNGTVLDRESLTSATKSSSLPTMEASLPIDAELSNEVYNGNVQS